MGERIENFLNVTTLFYYHGRSQNIPDKLPLKRNIFNNAHGITSKTPDLATAEQVLQDNRKHWSIENSCHYIIDWIFDEDRSRISKGYGPENITRLRRFAVGYQHRRESQPKPSE